MAEHVGGNGIPGSTIRRITKFSMPSDYLIVDGSPILGDAIAPEHAIRAIQEDLISIGLVNAGNLWIKLMFIKIII